MDSRYTSNIILAAYSLSAILFCLVMYNLWSSQVRSNLNNAGAWFLLIVKGFMSLLFMYRLYVCYSKFAFYHRMDECCFCSRIQIIYNI
eukprot:518473_1